MNPVVLEIARKIRTERGRALLVGGCVRDRLLGLPQTDFDLEVFGVAGDRLEAILRARFEVIDVGRSFGVLKIKGEPIDVSLPRRETKIGPGHRGFAIDTDPHLDVADAARRRDLTVNAIYLDPLDDSLIDPLGGHADLRARLLRHCSERFREDPLRVLRVMQFAARLEFSVHPDTVALCASLDLGELAAERIQEEFRKLLLKGRKPSLGLAFLANAGALRYFPSLDAGPATLAERGRILDVFAAHRDGGDSDWTIGLALLCADLETPEAARLVEQVCLDKQVQERVLRLLAEFEAAAAALEAADPAAAIRRLALRVRIDELARLATIRATARGEPSRVAAAATLRARAETLGVAASPPVALVQGRHLQEFGRTPGPAFGEILARCFEAQLDGAFDTESGGKRYLAQLLADPD